MEHRSDVPGPKGRFSTRCSPIAIRPCVVIIICILSSLIFPVSNLNAETPEVWEVVEIQPEIINVVPHDESAFTQGLEIHNGKLYESTGLYGHSSVRIVNMESGQIEAQYNLSDSFFGEGLTILNNTIIQLTWKENIALIYDIDSLEEIGNFSYEGEGWGICNSQTTGLWISDGTGQLKNSNSSSISFNQSIEVFLGGGPSQKWNELECIGRNGDILANRWFDDSIYLIHTSNGHVCQKVDFSSIRDQYETDSSGVLNGIAWDSETGNYWITGKNWSNYYEVKIEFVDLSPSCHVEPSGETTTDCMNCENNEGIGLIHLIALSILILVIYASISKRQTQKPSIVSEDE